MLQTPLRARVNGLRRGSVTFGLALALVAGLADAAAIHSRWLSTDHIDFVPASVWLASPAVWMFLSTITVLFALAIRLPAIAIPLVTFTIVGLWTVVRLRILVHQTGTTLIAPIVIGSALAAGGAALIAWRRRDTILGFFGWKRVSMVVGILSASFVIGYAGSCMPRRAVPAAAPNTSQPNILLVFLDTVRYDACGFDTAAARRSKLADFARGGIIYDQAFVPSPWTLPSHVSVLTGYGAPELGMDFGQQIYRGARATIAERLRASGYSTGAVMANPFLNPGTGAARGFDMFDYSRTDLDVCRTGLGFVLKLVPNARVPICRLSADRVTDRAIDFMARSPRPFFLTLNYMEAHIPHWVPPRYRPSDYQTFKAFDVYPRMDRARRSGEALPASDLRLLRRNYAIAMRYLDDSLDRLFSDLPERTIVIVLSDHGEQFGEHNLSMHANSLYRQLLHVPLTLRGPGIKPGRIKTPVDVTHVYGTILDLAGIRTRLPRLPFTPADPEPGPVISMHRQSEPSVNSPRFTSQDIWSVIDGNYHVIHWTGGRTEIYDLQNDPAEVVDLSSDLVHSQQAQPLIHMLKQIIERQPRVEDRSESFRGLGYLQ